MAKVQESEGFSDDQAAYISGTFLEAGSDATSSTLYGFVQAMVLYPEVQKKAQEEIDRVVGKDRLPDMDDEPTMQYVRPSVPVLTSCDAYALFVHMFLEGTLLTKSARFVVALRRRAGG